jgi:hypothetical protein
MILCGSEVKIEILVSADDPFCRDFAEQKKEESSTMEMLNKRFTYTVRLAGALVVLLAWGSSSAQGAAGDPFLLLLKGVYQPAKNAPNLGLTGVNLNDGSFSVTDIHRVSSGPGDAPNGEVIGKFYVQFSGGSLAVYDLPGGAIKMQFTAGGFPTVVPDGQGGVYLEGTFELTVVDATGIYRSFVGGYNHMVDRLHKLASGQFDESCFCIISLPEALALWWSSN